ncbi:MAG: pilus assembly protein CpaE [Erythrobacter sp.]|nr:pilus assembly protein CpaE [Erythrobacter sp.]MBA4046834.1 pilus assembly protein CpaE [Erythrobacter sp.]MBA4080482.1 pilus assembly protein CpaE [Erythrobacter sp.]
MSVEMGDRLRKGAETSSARMRPNLTVIVAPRFLEMSPAGAAAAGLLSSAQRIPLLLTEELTPAMLPGSGVVVVQVDPTVPSSMGRIEKLRARSPDLSIVVALEKTDLRLVRTLIRGGVSDAISLPLEEDELLQAVLAAAEQSREEVGLAPLVAVVRPLGGGGATTFVTHLAAGFAEAGHSCCLVDLDVQLGRATEVLGFAPRRTVADLLDAGTAIDETLLDAVIQRHSSGLGLVAAPSDIIPIESVDRDQLLRVLDLVRSQYDFVFVDLPPSLSNWSLTLLAQSDEILLLTEQGLSSLRQAKRLLGLFRSVGIDDKAVSVVVNRAQNKLFGSINTSDVEQALGKDILGVLRPDEDTIKVAQDQGLLVHELRGKSGYARDVRALVEKVRDRIAGAQE